jgi:hypothetical protein
MSPRGQHLPNSGASAMSTELNQILTAINFGFTRYRLTCGPGAMSR